MSRKFLFPALNNYARLSEASVRTVPNGALAALPEEAIPEGYVCSVTLHDCKLLDAY
jgi:hypothetical protein